MSLAEPERAPRPSRRPRSLSSGRAARGPGGGLLRMRLSGSFACRNCRHAPRPHPEGPPQAGVSKDVLRAAAPPRRTRRVP